MTDHSSAGENAIGNSSRRRVRIADFMRIKGLSLETRDDRLTPDDTLIEGQFLHRELRRGMYLHAGDVIEERAFTATSVLHEGLSCVFFLKGQVELNVGDRHFTFKGDQRGPVEGAAIMTTAQERFQRISRERQHVRHLVVSVTPEWLDGDGVGDVAGTRLAQRLFKDHLANHRWALTPRLRAVVQQVLAPSDMMPSLRNLFLEGRCVDIVTETISALLHVDARRQRNDALSRQELIRFERAREIIASDIAAPLSVETIARAAGVSASGLQRLFRVSEGCSVFEYVRNARLERGFAALRDGEASVQEASLMAGYACPANFATAFRRRYGLRPREVRRPGN